MAAETPPSLATLEHAKTMEDKKPWRVLVVDDEANARSALASLLTDDGYLVEQAEDGQAGLERLTSFAADVVLSDLRMPRLDGLSLLKRAKEDGLDAAFVMMTAFGSIETAVEAMRLGAENYLVKPVDANAVSIVLQKVIETQKLRREAATLRARARTLLLPQHRRCAGAWHLADRR